MLSKTQIIDWNLLKFSWIVAEDHMQPEKILQITSDSISPTSVATNVFFCYWLYCEKNVFRLWWTPFPSLSFPILLNVFWFKVKLYNLLLNWSPVSPVFTMTFSLLPQQGFHGKMKNQWRSLYSVLIHQSTLSDRWRQYELISSTLSVCVCKPHSQSAGVRAETDQFTPLQLSLQPFCLSSNWT